MLARNQSFIAILGTLWLVAVLFAIAAQSAAAQSQTNWRFDPMDAFNNLERVIGAVMTLESGHSASEHVKVIKEVVDLSIDQAWEKYQEKTLSAGGSWGPFEAGMDKGEFTEECGNLKQTYSSARNEEEFRKAFATNTARYLTEDGRKVIEAYLRSIEAIAKIAKPGKEFLLVTLEDATEKAIILRAEWPNIPGKGSTELALPHCDLMVRTSLRPSWETRP